MYKVYTSCEIYEVETLEEAKEIVASEWILDAKPDSTGFVNPWIDDEKGDQVEYTPSQEEIDTWH